MDKFQCDSARFLSGFQKDSQVGYVFRIQPSTCPLGKRLDFRSLNECLDFGKKFKCLEADAVFSLDGIALIARIQPGGQEPNKLENQ